MSKSQKVPFMGVVINNIKKSKSQKVPFRGVVINNIKKSKSTILGGGDK